MKRCDFHCDHCHAKAPRPDAGMATLCHPEWLELYVSQHEVHALDIHLCPTCLEQPQVIYQTIRRRLDKVLQEREALRRIHSGEVTTEA